MIKDRTNKNNMTENDPLPGSGVDIDYLRNMHDLESLFGFSDIALASDSDAHMAHTLPATSDDGDSGESESDYVIKDDEEEKKDEGTWTFVNSRLLNTDDENDSDALSIRPSRISLIVGSSKSGQKWRVSVPGYVDIGLKRKGPDGKIEEYEEFIIVDGHGPHIIFSYDHPDYERPSISYIHELYNNGCLEEAEAMLSDVTRAMFYHQEPIERFSTLAVSSLLRDIILDAIDEGDFYSPSFEEKVSLLLSMMAAE
ncbi:MAG: hypothetical protein IKQ60_05330 [Candidatus Methanomethylophilaceae archaeon]|nr:hypothetical protein [Candidatus Methanomethylophilaceae archaeon]